MGKRHGSRKLNRTLLHTRIHSIPSAEGNGKKEGKSAGNRTGSECRRTPTTALSPREPMLDVELIALFVFADLLGELAALAGPVDGVSEKQRTLLVEDLHDAARKGG